MAIAVAFVLAGLAWTVRPQDTSWSAHRAADVGVPHRAAREAVLFIGDSYTDGRHGLREMSPSCRAAASLGMLCHLSAVPGTGYVSGGPANRFLVDEYRGASTSFAERVPSLSQSVDPRVVVLDGGRNDVFVPRRHLLAAMTATVADVHVAWPRAAIVLERPRFLARPADDLGVDGDLTSRLIRDTTAARILVIDPIGSLSTSDTRGLVGPDGVHPNASGDRALAYAIAESLRRRGFDLP